MRVHVALDRQCELAGLPKPEAEVKFHPGRRWRFDYGWRDRKIAVEINGGAFLVGGGRHTRGSGYAKDCEKLAEAAILGWRVIPVLPNQIANGQALNLISRAFREGSHEIQRQHS